MCYQDLQTMKDMVMSLTMCMEDVMTWWVDALYAVHEIMRGHTRGTMSVGTGSIYTMLSKQKLVSHSSTKAELIGMYDIMPQMVWVANFLQSQGISLICVILIQDNMSSFLLKKNGCASSSKRTKHIEVCYFFIKE